MLADAAGLKMTAVSYRASNLSIQDLLGGQIKLACDDFAVAYEQVKGGKVRAVSITSPGPYRSPRRSRPARSPRCAPRWKSSACCRPMQGPAYADPLKKEREGYARIIEKAGIKAP